MDSFALVDCVHCARIVSHKKSRVAHRRRQHGSTTIHSLQPCHHYSRMHLLHPLICLTQGLDVMGHSFAPRSSSLATMPRTPPFFRRAINLPAQRRDVTTCKETCHTKKVGVSGTIKQWTQMFPNHARRTTLLPFPLWTTNCDRMRLHPTPTACGVESLGSPRVVLASMDPSTR